MTITPTSSSAICPSIPHGIMRPHCFIETSGEINEFMKMHAINFAEEEFQRVGKRLYGVKVAIMGLAYKKSDPRGSPAIKIIVETKAGVFASVEGALRGAECAVFLVDHDVFREISMEMVRGLMASSVVVDGKNLFEGAGDRVVVDWERGEEPLGN